MKRELGDILWYWCQGRHTRYTPEEVMVENIRKLENDTRMVLRLCVARTARKWHIMEFLKNLLLLPYYSFNYISIIVWVILLSYVLNMYDDGIF